MMQRRLMISLSALLLLRSNLMFAAVPLTNESKVTFSGIGPIKAGMTLHEVRKQTSMTFKIDYDKELACGFAFPRNPQGLQFMIVKGRVVRIDIIEPSPIQTLAGAHIGNSEEEIKKLYPGQVTVKPHEYDENGHYLIITPKDAADKKYRLLFETSRGMVTQFRSGLEDPVQWVEGCY